MKLSSALYQAINAQMNKEWDNRFAYEAMQLVLQENSWDGFGRWFHNQAHDEQHHAHLWRDWLLDRECSPVLNGHAPPVIPTVANPDDMPLVFMQQAHLVEQSNTATIEAIYHQAVSEGDGEAVHEVSKFLKKQKHEEDFLVKFIPKLLRAKGNNAAMFLLDRKIKQIAGPRA